MISDIKVDFSDLKSILINVVQHNKSLIESDENLILKELYKNYHPKSMIDGNELSRYKTHFNDFYAERCKKLSKYRSDDNENFNRTDVNSLENDGKLFSSGIFVSLIKHLRMEQALLGEDNQIAICILESLHAHLGNIYYYAVDNNILEPLFESAVLLYLSDTNCWNMKDIETLEIIKSMKRLLNTYRIDYEIKNGEIFLSDKTDKIIQSSLGNLIAMLGGVDFFKELFVRNIMPKYNSIIDRFLIHRNKQQFTVIINELRVPFNYLIHIGIKYINVKKSILLTETGVENAFYSVIQNSSDYLNVLNLQSYSIFSDMIYDFKTIPLHLSKNIAFEKMFTPVQYRPDFVCEFLRKVYAPLFENIDGLEYSFNDYMQFCQTILDDKRICVIYTFDELKRKTSIKKKALKSILLDVSFNYNDVNCMFDSFLSKTNYNEKPLVKLEDNTYFLLSAYFNGFAFCEVIYHKLKSLYPTNIDRDKRFKIEDMIKSFLDNKKYPYHCGNYRINKSQRNECDLVIENNKQIVFLEIKNRPLPETFEQGDDVSTLRCLAEGMIKAQIQCLKHEYYLKKNGNIILENDIDEDKPVTYQLNWNKRRVICISICAQEYLFLTNKGFSEKLLESLLVSTYHANDENKESELYKLNMMSNKLKDIVNKMYKSDINIKQVFFNTLFRSAQQLFTILSVSNSLDEFIHYLTEPIYIMDGSDDVYCQLLGSIKMIKYKGDKI
ncbi:MAG: hypothetical protein ACI4HN_08550 [Ruminococcus sp.]